MPYEISDKQYEIAEQLGIDICVSENPRKKIDVYKKGQFLFSIGAVNFKSLSELIEMYGRDEAYRKRNLYLSRHKSQCDLKSIYEIRLLWCDD